MGGKRVASSRESLGLCGTFWLRNEGLRSSGSAVAK